MITRSLILTGIILTGCYTPPSVVYVQTPAPSVIVTNGAEVASPQIKPAPVVETIVAAPPYSDCTWQPGYWAWKGNVWVWMPGCWYNPYYGYWYPGYGWRVVYGYRGEYRGHHGRHW